MGRSRANVTIYRVGEFRYRMGYGRYRRAEGRVRSGYRIRRQFSRLRSRGEYYVYGRRCRRDKGRAYGTYGSGYVRGPLQGLECEV